MRIKIPGTGLSKMSAGWLFIQLLIMVAMSGIFASYTLAGFVWFVKHVDAVHFDPLEDWRGN